MSTQALRLVVRDNYQATAVASVVRAWRNHDQAAKQLARFINRGNLLFHSQDRPPLTIELLPANLDAIEQLCTALYLTARTGDLLVEVEKYIIENYPDRAIAVKFAGGHQNERLRLLLRRHGYWTLPQLRRTSDTALLDINGINKESLDRIRKLSE